MADFRLTSEAFKHGGTIPQKYTCDGADINPPLSIENPPPGTQSFTLIMDDPDAPVGTWDHWIMWNIPVSVTTIVENSIPEGASLGRNSFGKLPYGGPCPPPGNPHRYFFKLYALSTPSLNIPEGSTKKTLEKTIDGLILGQTELMGLYQRS